MAIVDIAIELIVIECECGLRWHITEDELAGECPDCGLPYNITIEYTDNSEE